MTRSARFSAPLFAMLAMALGACQDTDSDILGPSSESAQFAKGGNGGKPGGGGPAANRIAFSVTGANARINTVNPDGSSYTAVPNTDGGTDPAWSPDRKKLAFAIPSGPDAGLYVINTNGKQCTRLYAGPAGAPAWSADGRIAFEATVASSTQIFVIGANGTNLQQVTALGTLNTHPSWSADGRMVYHSNRAGGYGLWVVSANGNQRTVILHCGSACSSPTWSPVPGDERIAFNRYHDGTLEFGAIGVVLSDGTPVDDVASSLSHQTTDLLPSWSPNGTQLVFRSRMLGGTMDLLIMNDDGSDIRRLTNTSAGETAAAWGR